MKKMVIALFSIGMFTLPATAEIPGLNTDITLYKSLSEKAKKQGRTTQVKSTSREEAGSTFGRFNSQNPLPSTQEPIVQSR